MEYRNYDNPYQFHADETLIIGTDTAIQKTSSILIVDNKIENRKDEKITKIRRYSQYKDFIERLEQEGISNVLELKNKKLSEFVQFHKNTKIPPIEHIVYLFKDTTSNMPNYLIDKVSNNYKNLRSNHPKWKLIFWTNIESNVPKSLTILPDVEIRNINSLKHHKLYNNLTTLIDEATTSSEYKSILTQASDIVRIMALNEGGVYHDCDYLINDAEELIKYMKIWGLIIGLESDSPNADLGNAFIAAIPNHPMIKLAAKLMYRNLNDENSPAYVQYPINKFDKIIFETGPALITASYYVFIDIAYNYGGKDDSIILPDKILFNTNWDRAQISEGQKCTYRGQTSQCFNFDDEEICSVGGDLLCGTWGAQPGFFDPLPTEIIKDNN